MDDRKRQGRAAPGQTIQQGGQGMTVNDHIHHFTIRSVTELEELGGRLYEM